MRAHNQYIYHPLYINPNPKTYGDATSGGLGLGLGPKADRDATSSGRIGGSLSAHSGKRTLVELEKFVQAYAHDLDSNNEILMAVLLTHMIQVCLQITDSCGRAYRFLDESGYALDALQQLFFQSLGGVQSDEVQKFVGEYCQAYLLTFPTIEDWKCVIRILSNFLQRGMDEWQVPTLYALGAFLSRTPHLWTDKLFVSITRTVLDFSGNPDSALSTAADFVMRALMEHCPSGLLGNCREVFNFMRNPADLTKQSKIEEEIRNTDRFPGASLREGQEAHDLLLLRLTHHSLKMHHVSEDSRHQLFNYNEDDIFRDQSPLDHTPTSSPRMIATEMQGSPPRSLSGSPMREAEAWYDNDYDSDEESDDYDEDEESAELYRFTLSARYWLTGIGCFAVTSKMKSILKRRMKMKTRSYP